MRPMSASSLRESRLGRRAVTVPAVLLAALVLYPASLLVLPAALVFDLLRGRPRLPTLRVLGFGLTYLGWEVVAIMVSAALWVASGFGLLLRTRAFQEAHRKVQVHWARSNIRNLRRFLNMRLEVTGAELLGPGPVIVLSRHASMVDTLIPIQLADDVGLGCRYVLKDELLWDPALDLMGHRFPNHFVDRSGGNSEAAVAAVGDLAAGTRDTEAFIIFPEGSRFTEEKRDRAIEKLSVSNPAAAERARKLTATMPPRTGGPLEALSRRPKGADVVVIAHTGLEGLAGPLDLWRVAPFRHAVRFEMWRIPSEQIPEPREELLEWLYDRWAEVDAWVSAHAD